MPSLLNKEQPNLEVKSYEIQINYKGLGSECIGILFYQRKSDFTSDYGTVYTREYASSLGILMDFVDNHEFIAFILLEIFVETLSTVHKPVKKVKKKIKHLKTIFESTTLFEE